MNDPQAPIRSGTPGHRPVLATSGACPARIEAETASRRSGTASVAAEGGPAGGGRGASPRGRVFWGSTEPPNAVIVAR